MNIRERRIFEVEVDGMTIEELNDIISRHQSGLDPVSDKIKHVGFMDGLPIVDETPEMPPVKPPIDTSNQYKIIAQTDMILNRVIAATRDRPVYFANTPFIKTIKDSALELTDDLVELDGEIDENDWNSITDRILFVVDEVLTEDINAIYLFSYQLLSIGTGAETRHAIKIRYALI